MIKFICHPDLTSLLEKSQVEMNCAQSSVEVVLISDYYPQGSHQIHGGLIEAVKCRLTNPSCYIFFTSFFSHEVLLKHDTFGVLSLHGTEFIRLPFRVEELYSAIVMHVGNELSIPKEEWILFSTNACIELIKDKIGVLKHGGKFDFVNSITGPLRAAAVGSYSFPELFSVIKNHLKSVECFNAKEEIAELFLLAKLGAALPDEFLQAVSQFTTGLQRMEIYASHEDINIKQLISEIDILNEISSKIQNYDGAKHLYRTIY